LSCGGSPAAKAESVRPSATGLALRCNGNPLENKLFHHDLAGVLPSWLILGRKFDKIEDIARTTLSELPVSHCNTSEISWRGILLNTEIIEGFWSRVAPAFETTGGPFESAVIKAASHALHDIAPELTIEGGKYPGGNEIVIGTHGVRRHFSLARAFAAKAPPIPGVRVKALRSERQLPDALVRDGIELPLDTTRVTAVQFMGRYGILLLTRAVKIHDYVAFRNLAKQAVMDLLGEERFGLFVTDVQVMDHADWETGAGEETSVPFAELARIIPHPAGPVPAPVAQDSRATS
jgi:hypothetical protein